MESRLNSHYESLTRAIAFTKTADTKAAPVLGLHIALVGTLAARFDVLWNIITKSPSYLECAFLISLLALYILLLIIAVCLTALVYIPKNPRTGSSLIYFEDIAAMEYKEFEELSKDLSPQKIEQQLLGQVHIVSKIASTKMRKVRWAFWISLPSIGLWLVLLAWGSIN